MTTPTKTKKLAKVKCPTCEQYFQREEGGIQHNKRWYHSKCFESVRKQLNAEDREKQHRQELVDYICERFNMEYPNGFILKQMKDYRETYNYQYKGMELSLRYFLDIQDNPITVNTIGIVPFVYDKAKEFYRTNLEAKKHFQNLSEDITSAKTVNIKSPLDIKHKKVRQIDIGEL